MVWPLGEELPPLAHPFGVLVDADDDSWSDSRFRADWIPKLLDAGCRYVVCFGEHSEALHDLIDDIVTAGGEESVLTTWHDDEAPEDVVEFFTDVVGRAMATTVILVGDQDRWIRVL